MSKRPEPLDTPIGQVVSPCVRMLTAAESFSEVVECAQETLRRLTRYLPVEGEHNVYRNAGTTGRQAYAIAREAVDLLAQLMQKKCGSTSDPLCRNVQHTSLSRDGALSLSVLWQSVDRLVDWFKKKRSNKAGELPRVLRDDFAEAVELFAASVASTREQGPSHLTRAIEDMQLDTSDFSLDQKLSRMVARAELWLKDAQPTADVARRARAVAAYEDTELPHGIESLTNGLPCDLQTEVLAAVYEWQEYIEVGVHEMNENFHQYHDDIEAWKTMRAAIERAYESCGPQLRRLAARCVAWWQVNSASDAKPSKPRVALANDDRDEWIYSQVMKLVPYETIKLRLKKKTKWARIGSANGIKLAAIRYAEAHQLDPIPIRQRGVKARPRRAK